MTKSTIMRLSCELREASEWDKWIEEIPYIQFPLGWKIKIIPPYVGAVIRFLVSLPGKKGNISVYLDCYSILGCVDKPYWEVYPYKDDTIRVGLNEIEELLAYINVALDGLENES